MENLLTGFQIDDFFRWTKGRTEKLARLGQLPFVKLPNGDCRFVFAEIEQLIQHVPATTTAIIAPQKKNSGPPSKPRSRSAQARKKDNG